MKKKTWTTYTVGTHKVRYAKGTRPRADGIQITFTDKTVTPPLRRQSTWRRDPSLQLNANGADVKRDLILAEIRAGTFKMESHFDEHENRRAEPAPVANGLLFVDAISERLNEPHFKSSTMKKNKGFIAEFKKRWPTLLLKDLTVDLVRDWMNDRKHAGSSIKTIENKITFISPVLRRAVRLGQLRINPLDLLDERADYEPGKKESTRRAVKESTGRRIDPFDIKELNQVLEKMNGHSNRLTQSANLVAIYLNGLRTGEGFSLSWDDVNWTRGKYGTIRISRTYTEKVLDARKNCKKVAVYEMELDEQGRQALERQKEFTYGMAPYETGTEFGKLRLIFRDMETGKPLWNDDHLFRNMWERLLKNACVRYRPPYHLRHTCATYALSSGEPIEWIAKYKLGNSPEIVRTNYADWRRDFAAASGHEPGLRLDAMFKSLRRAA